MSIRASFDNFSFKDELKFEGIIRLLRKVYINEYVRVQEENIPFQGFECNIGPVRNIYKRSFNCPLPFIDTEIWENITPKAGHSFPKSILSKGTKFTTGSKVCEIRSDERRSFAREAEQSTIECIKSYSARSRRLSTYERNCIRLSGIKAAEELRICRVDGRKIPRSKRLVSLEQCVLKTARNTNSGFPFFRKKNSKLCISDTIIWLNNFFNKPTLYSLIKNPLIELPTTIFYRVQPSIEEALNEVNIKIRQVWGIPQRIVCLEYYFFNSILQNVYNNNLFGKTSIYSSGLTNYQISTRIVQRLRKAQLISGKKLYSMDYSKFDRTVPSYAVDLFYAISKEALELNEQEDKIFDLLRFYIKHTPYIWKGNLFIKMKGVPSGSYITNLIDTWWNYTLWILSYMVKNYYSKNLENFLNKDLLLDKEVFDYISNTTHYPFVDIGICGDDSLALTDSFHIYVLKRICKEFEMNIVEFSISNNIYQNTYFLGRYWDFESRPIQTDTYFIGHLALRTKFYKKEELNFDISEELAITRMLSICLAYYNGLDFLKRYFGNYDKLQKFLKGSKGFYLLKDWPLVENYRYINRIDAESWTSF